MPVDDLPFDEEFENLPDPELLEEEEMACLVIAGLIEKLELKAEISSGLSEVDDQGQQIVEIRIEGVDGEELGELIGRQGETLATFQYLTRLMVSQRVRRRVDFVVDVNGYKQMREAGVMRMADRMAEKVISRGSPVTLEPMSSYERRLIHIRLRDHDGVYTKSIGVGSQRRIRIHPKKAASL